MKSTSSVSPAPNQCAGSGSKPLRRDAQRTRRLVMDAAKELFAERGLDVGFDEIARRAGVGVGTVYRRFPDRDTLVEALFAEKMEAVLELLSTALGVADPWEGVVSFCERSIEEQQKDRGLAQVLVGSAPGQEQLAALRDQLAAALIELLERAQRAGVVRRDIEVGDLALATHLYSRIAVDDGTEIWRRYLALFFDGIRVPPGHRPLPGPAPTLQMFEEISHRL